MNERAKALFIIFLSVWLTLTFVSFNLERSSVNIEELFLQMPINGSIKNVHVLRITPADFAPRNDVAVVMFHSFVLSAYSLKPMGIEIARRGFCVIIPDLPGHGFTDADLLVFVNTSDLGVSVPSAVVYMRDFFDSVAYFAKKSANPSNPNSVKLVLIGHSYGGGLAIVYAALRDDVIATISLTPVGVDSVFRNEPFKYLANYLNSTSPKNVLIIKPVFDEVHGKIDMLKTLEILGVKDPKENQLYGSFNNGSARMFVETGLIEHFSFQYDGSVMHYVLDWIGKAINKQIESSIFFEPFRIVIIWTAMIMGILALMLIGPALAEYFGTFSGGKRWPKIEMKTKSYKTALIWPFITIFFTIVVAIPLLFLAAILRLTAYITLSLVIGYYIGSITALLYLIAHWRKITIREAFRWVFIELFRDSRPVLLGIVIVIFMFMIFLSTISPISVPLIPTSINKITGIIAFFPLALLFSLPYDMLFRREIQEAFGGGTVEAAAYAASLSTLARFIYILILAAIFTAITRLLGFAILLIIILMIIQVFAETLAASLYLATREVTPEAVSNSLFWLVVTYAMSPAVLLVGSYIVLFGFRFA